MTDPGRQRETKYLFTINRPCAYIHFRFKAALVCILIKVIAELFFLGIFFFLIFYLTLKIILLGVNYITVLLSVSQSGFSQSSSTISFCSTGTSVLRDILLATSSLLWRLYTSWWAVPVCGSLSSIEQSRVYSNVNAPTIPPRKGPIQNICRQKFEKVYIRRLLFISSLIVS